MNILALVISLVVGIVIGVAGLWGVVTLICYIVSPDGHIWHKGSDGLPKDNTKVVICAYDNIYAIEANSIDPYVRGKIVGWAYAKTFIKITKLNNHGK